MCKIFLMIKVSLLGGLPYLIVHPLILYLFGKTLTHQTTHAAPPANHNAAKSIPANRAWLASMPINPQKRRIAIILAFRPQIFFRRYLVLFYKKGKTSGNNRGRSEERRVGKECRL